jgi:hypothetical protein
MPWSHDRNGGGSLCRLATTASQLATEALRHAVGAHLNVCLVGDTDDVAALIHLTGPR